MYDKNAPDLELQGCHFRTSNGYTRYVVSLTALSDADLASRLRDLRQEQLRRAGKTRACSNCGNAFTARLDALYCSTACRVMACRARSRLKRCGEDVTAKNRQPLLTIKAAGRSAAASPLRYPGGKAALAGFFGQLIARIGIRRPTYVEPYAGGAGAGVVLLQQGIAKKLVINDIDPAVYCFWKSVTERTEAFATKIMDVPLAVDEWRRQREIYRAADESDPLTLGFAFFYLNRTNRSGILGAGPIGGVSQNGNYKIDARYNRKQLADRVIAIGNLSDRIEVSNLDGMAVIRRYMRQKSAFIYVDPPYVDMGGSLYLNAFTHRDHADLAKLLTDGRDANWVLTYDPSDFIRRQYKGHVVQDYQLSYSANRSGKVQELLVASRPVSKLLSRN